MRKTIKIFIDWLIERKERRVIAPILIALLSIPIYYFASALEKWGLTLSEATIILLWVGTFVSAVLLFQIPEPVEGIVGQRNLDDTKAKALGFFNGLVEALQGPNWIRNSIIYLLGWFIPSGILVEILRPEGTSYADYELFGGFGWVGALMVVFGVASWFFLSQIANKK